MLLGRKIIESLEREPDPQAVTRIECPKESTATVAVFQRRLQTVLARTTRVRSYNMPFNDRAERKPLYGDFDHLATCAMYCSMIQTSEDKASRGGEQDCNSLFGGSDSPRRKLSCSSHSLFKNGYPPKPSSHQQTPLKMLMPLSQSASYSTQCGIQYGRLYDNTVKLSPSHNQHMKILKAGPKWRVPDTDLSSALSQSSSTNILSCQSCP